MKIKIALFLLAAAGIVLSGCTGSPAQVDRYGNMQPVSQTYNPGPAYSNINPRHNLDGSVTVFSKGNFQIKILPMTVRRTRGASSGTTDEFDAQIAEYLETLQANPQDYDAYIILAGLYINRDKPGDAEEAIKYSSQAIEIDRNDIQALYVRGLAYAAQGEGPKAISDLEAVLRPELEDPKGIYYIIGTVYYKDGKVDEAIEAFEKVKSLDPEFVDTSEILEQLYSLK
jgi:tetratricopeptide (TPR) repeat protein